MTKMKKLTSLVLAAAMALSLMVPAMAASSNTGNDRIDYYGITASGAQKIEPTKNLFGMYTNQLKEQYDIIIEVPVSETQQTGQDVTTVDLSSLQTASNLSMHAKRDLVDSIMQTLGYPELAINEMEDDTKLEIIDGEEVTSVVATRTISDPAWGTTSNTKNSIKSVLSYTRRTKGELYIINNATLTGNSSGLNWRQSIAAQGCAMESGTSEVEYSYKKVNSSTGASQTIKNTYTETSTDGNYEPIVGAAGTGICYSYKMPASTNAVYYQDVMYTESVTTRVSNVNDGGSFNIYGNMALLMVSLNFAVSYPWSISVDLGETQVIHCRTQLTTLYQ